MLKAEAVKPAVIRPALPVVEAAAVVVEQHVRNTLQSFIICSKNCLLCLCVAVQYSQALCVSRINSASQLRLVILAPYDAGQR